MCDIDNQVLQALARKEAHLAYQLAAARVMETPECWRGERAMGGVFFERHQNEFALTHIRRAIALYTAQPDCTPQGLAVLWTGQGNAELRSGDLSSAVHSFQTAAGLDLSNLDARRGLKEAESKLSTRGTRDHNGHALLNEGHALERNGDFRGAWVLYTKAKNLLAEQGFRYDAGSVETRLAGFKAQCTAARMLRLFSVLQPDQRTESFTPLFVLGYPRSGTTLLEQCLSQSNHVIAGDELPFIVEIVNGAQRFFASPHPYPWCMDELALADTGIAIQNLRDHYRGRVIERLLNGVDAWRGFVTDKMPLNETFLPLIHLMFPRAPLVLIERNPLDVIVSNFSLFLTHGSHQACDPVSCHHHIAAVRDLVAHYRAKLPGLRLLTVSYRALVTAPELTLRRICEFAGLEFSPEMLHPEHATRFCRTASWAQVREPISTKALDRWRNFEPELRAALGGHLVERYAKI